MLVPDAGLLELTLEFPKSDRISTRNTRSYRQGCHLLLVDVLEDVLEATVVSLQNCVLGAEVKRIFLLESISHAAPGESSNGLISVVHAHANTTSGEFEDIISGGGTAIVRCENNLEFARLLHNEISGSVLFLKRKIR